MAQRIRSCTNSTNLDTINCDSYVPRLLKRDRPAIGNKPGSAHKGLRDSSALNLGTSPALTTPPNLKSRSCAVRQQNLPQPTKNAPNPKNVVYHREPSDNPPVIEVTVKSQSNSNSNRRSCTGDTKSSRQPWGQLLKSARSSETLSSFSNFDPLRTLHFLAKELKSKLKTVTPIDPNMIQMVSDMEHALNRIPQEVISSMRLHQDFENLPLKRSASEVQRRDQTHRQTEHPLARPPMEHRSSQTVHVGEIILNTEIFHKQLEASANKLEGAYKSMEKLCTQLKSEKEEVELLLLAEKDTVKFLRKQIDELETEKTETRNIAFEKLAEERDNLQTQVKRLQVKIDSQGSSSFRELKSIVQELQHENAAIKQENLALRHKATLSSMEKEKYIAILNVRDRQINEIRAEMNQLQQIITEQLTELQRSSFNSSPASQSAVLGNLTGVLRQANQHYETGYDIPPPSIARDFTGQHNFKDVQAEHLSRGLPYETSGNADLDYVTSKMKEKVYESGISHTQVFKLFSASNSAEES